MNNLLNNIYKNVCYWLNYAEIKNATLIVFNISFLSISSKLFNILKEPNIIFYIVSILLIISTGILLFSFVPSLNKNQNSSFLSNQDIESYNLLFYGNIAQFSESYYLEQLETKYIINKNLNKDNYSLVYNKDLISEIIQNSKITVRKFLLFKIALIINILAFILILLSLIPFN